MKNKKRLFLPLDLNVRFGYFVNGTPGVRIDTQEQICFIPYKFLYLPEPPVSSAEFGLDTLKNWRSKQASKTVIPIIDYNESTFPFLRKVYNVLCAELKRLLRVGDYSRRVATYRFLLPLLVSNVEEFGEAFQKVEFADDPFIACLAKKTYDKNNNYRG